MKAVGNFLVIQEKKEKTTKTKGGLLLTDKIKEDINSKMLLLSYEKIRS